MQRFSVQCAQRAVASASAPAFRPANLRSVQPLLFRQPFTAGPPRASDAALPADASRPPPVSYPYYVGRSASQNLAVYHRTKSGGSNRTTEIKKVEGDAQALSRQLQEALHVETKINARTNTVIVKGLHKERVTAWLEARGF